ncbi:MAG: hypothetical protein CXT77_02245 [uncultured DHVE6 group euryarchaeote]|jgi:hypothetical protein|nr:MAG: hypothetical protein CXT77_02245 [uncultured DHVE6 group euryarchaeote]
MKRGQISTAYLGILTVISIAIFALVLFWSMSIKETQTDFLSEAQIDLLIEKVESDIYFIENIKSNVSETIFELSNSIPSRIGSDFYTITLNANGDQNSGGAFLNDSEIIISKESSSQFSLPKTIFIKSINTDLPIRVSSVYSANQRYVLRYNSSVGIEIH